MNIVHKKHQIYAENVIG